MTRRARHLPGRHLRGEGVVRRAVRVGPTAVAIALLLTALVVVAVPMATDHEWRTVTTGSMRPMIQPGDVILAAPLDRQPHIGDVVTFIDPIDGDRQVVHRIVAVDADGRFVTRGDANNGNDPWALSPEEVQRTVALTIPKVGSVVTAVNSKAGILAFLVVPALGLMISEVRVWYRFIRYGADAFETTERGRHRPGRGRHVQGATT